MTAGGTVEGRGRSPDPAGTAPGPPRGSGRPGRAGAPGAHALRVLEFDQVLGLVAREAGSELGAERVRELRPRGDPASAREGLRAVDEAVGFLLRDESWAPPPIPDLRSLLRRLGITGSVLEPEELRSVAVLLASCRKARRDVLPVSGDFERLAGIARDLAKEPDLQERLERSIDEGGQVADGASSELRRLRRDLREARSSLVERLEAFIAGLDDRLRVEDASVTVRNGRYCVPLRREGRSRVGGIVHDESASRQTLFVEPPAAIEPMNRIRELELAEAREVRRILAELTDLLRPKADALSLSLGLLAELDSLYARARYALLHGGASPELGEGGRRGTYRVVEGRHPLLLRTEEVVVPFDLELAEGETVLLVSGPNAGGKTVLLKCVGLFSAMAQSGIVPPVGPGTRLPTFGGFFAVIGDEQSIEASLSTFSAQVRNLRAILEEADATSLVLLDELGGHTDPAEGSALAAATLLRLAGQAALTVATTHLGALKTLAGERDGIVNASLEFDAQRLRPSYRLRRDRPGRSYALEIARRLGLPRDLLQEARARLGTGERALDTVLGELEGREAELERVTREARGKLAEAGRRVREAEERWEEVRGREREVERREREVERRARQRAETYLLEARKRVEEAIRRLEARYEEAAREATAGAAEEAAGEARGEVERALRETRARKPEPLPTREDVPAAEVGEGDPVRIRSLDRVGRVQEVRGDRAIVVAGNVRLTVPREDLEPVEEEAVEGSGAGAGGPPPAWGDGAERRPDVEPRMEVDLRGLRVDEVQGALTPALDAAIYGDLPRLRIIHGKGTGAVRDRVRELLRADGRVPRFRPGDLDEGGSGVTVIEFREES